MSQTPLDLKSMQQIIDLMTQGGTPLRLNYHQIFSALDEAERASPPMSESPPTAPLAKEELLLKLLRMTTNTNDGEALTAIRKANDLLRAAGWDWEMLIRAKIKVVEDPFKNLQQPKSRRDESSYSPKPTAPQKPTPQPPPVYATAQQAYQARQSYARTHNPAPPPPRPAPTAAPVSSRHAPGPAVAVPPGRKNKPAPSLSQL